MSNIVDKIKVLKQSILEESFFPGNNWPTRGGLTQRDNRLFPGGSCNFTAAANCLEYLQVPISEKTKKKIYFEQTEDVLSAVSETPEAHKEFLKYYKNFDSKKSEVRPRHFSQMVAWTVNRATEKNIAIWGERTFDDFVAAVENKIPVVVSGKFTQSGHFISIKGLAKDKTFFWVDDSWGDFYTGYKKTNGFNLRYLFDDVKRLCWQHQKKHKTIFFTGGET